jgi:hypothetical protein
VWKSFSRSNKILFVNDSLVLILQILVYFIEFEKFRTHFLKKNNYYIIYLKNIYLIDMFINALQNFKNLHK